MAGENTAVVQAIFEAYFRGDTPAWRALADPEIVVTQLPEQPDVRPYHGHEGLEQVITDWTGTWADYTLDVVDIREAGEHVVVTLDQSGKGKASGIEIHNRVFFVFTLRAGKVTRLQMFSSEEEAVAATGEDVAP